MSDETFVRAAAIECCEASGIHLDCAPQFEPAIRKAISSAIEYRRKYLAEMDQKIGTKPGTDCKHCGNSGMVYLWETRSVAICPFCQK